MGSDPNVQQQQEKGLDDKPKDEPISREPSFLSLKSVGSGAGSSATYFTAKGDGDSSSIQSSLYFTADSGGGNVSDATAPPEEPKSPTAEEEGYSICSTTDSNSTTLEEADSLRSSEEGNMEEFEMAYPTMSSPHLTSSSSSSLGNGIEIREDISRICNTIAESDGLDYVKKTRIEAALRDKRVETLADLAASNGGLLSNALRTKAWPLLLKVSAKEVSVGECKKIPLYYPNVPEKICNLVQLDVARVLKRFPPGLTDPQQDHLQIYLNSLICSVLQENRKAYYYQGFHDISLTFLLVSISQNAPYLAYLCLDKMIQTNLDPYMEKTMDKTHDVIHVLFSILEKEDLDLYKKIVVECKCPVAFCLPWVLTWFSHTLPSDTDIFRLHDFILGSQERLTHTYLIPIFVSASLLLRNSKVIKSDNELCDIASMHHRLAKLPSELDGLEPWLADSLKLMMKYKRQEEKLLSRGVEIKEYQNRLWNEDNNNYPSSAPNEGVVMSVSRFLFVRHRWTTASIVILGAAFLIQKFLEELVNRRRSG